MTLTGRRPDEIFSSASFSLLREKLPYPTLRSAIGMRFSLLAHLCSQLAILIVALSVGTRTSRQSSFGILV